MIGTKKQDKKDDIYIRGIETTWSKETDKLKTEKARDGKEQPSEW